MMIGPAAMRATEKTHCRPPSACGPRRVHARYQLVRHPLSPVRSGRVIALLRDRGRGRIDMRTANRRSGRFVVGESSPPPLQPETPLLAHYELKRTVACSMLPWC